MLRQDGLWYHPAMRLLDQGLAALIQNQPDLGSVALGGAIAAGLAALGWATVGWVDPTSKDKDPNAPWIVLGYTMGSDGKPHRFETDGQALDWAIDNEDAPGIPRGAVPVVFSPTGGGFGPYAPPSEFLNKGWTAEQARQARSSQVRAFALGLDKDEFAAKAAAAIQYQQGGTGEFYVGRDGITRSIYDREDDG